MVETIQDCVPIVLLTYGCQQDRQNIFKVTFIFNSNVEFSLSDGMT